MTRRITLAILAVVWLALIGAGLTTYFITRSLLIQDLDDSIISRVASLPQVEPPTGPLKPVSPGAGDRVVIVPKNAPQKDISLTNRPPVGDPVPVTVTVNNSVFSTDIDGTRLRTLTLFAYKRRVNQTDELIPQTIVYSAPTDHIDTLLRNLTYSLTAFGLAAAATAMLAARVVARVALQPIRDAAEVIGEINERSLDRRIATKNLPSELVPVSVKLNDMLARLEIAFTQRKQFLADASHELRTPVAALVVTLEVALRRQRDNADYIRALDRCLSDAKQLHQLVVALVNQARSERYGHDPEVQPVAVSTLLRQCAQMVSPLADSKGISLERHIPDNLMVLTDEQLLRTMVSNLLSNAVEYTPASPTAGTSNGAEIHPGSPHGQITFTAHLLLPENESALPKLILKAIPEGVKASARRLVIQVKDNGPGIPPEKLRSIFEPFFRADASRANPEHHLGLGLALVQNHVHALGGSCTVESPPPGELTGSLFTLDLPTAEVCSENNAPILPEKPVFMGNTA